MRKLLGLLLLLPLSGQANIEVSGVTGGEARGYFSDGLYDEQSRHSFSYYVNPEFYYEFENRADSIVFSPFGRVDSQDSERTHVDIRELLWLHFHDSWELRTGIGKVFWGVTESQHLVDVINQTDFVESPDGEDKLGQPMINLSWLFDSGTLSGFVLPGFREQTFPGKNGRFRTPVRLNQDDALYESSAKQSHIDVALRWSQTVDVWDYGLSYFQGTQREPELIIVPTSSGDSELRPFYAQMTQLGLDVQATIDDMLYKTEVIYRDGSDEFVALTTGFEYTFTGIFDQYWDLGVLVEFQYDSRGKNGGAPGQNDVFSGLRWQLNNANSTEVLAGVTQDLDRSHSRSMMLEATSRISNHWKWNLDIFLFASDDPSDPLYLFRKDDVLQLSIDYYL